MDKEAKPPPEEVLEPQRTVQRKLGRCLLHLQQYERLLKLIIAHSEVAGPLNQLKANRDRKIASTKKLTLGTLMGMLTDKHMVPSLEERELLQVEPSLDNQFWFSFRTLIEISPEHFDTTKIALKELVDLRNELVHYFIERFDLWTLGGCIAADEFLEASYETIDRHYKQLHTWALSIGENRLEMFKVIENFLSGHQANGTQNDS